MAATASSSSSAKANINGVLDILVEKSLTIGELIAYLPDAKAVLDEITRKGWKYYFIEGYGTALMEIQICSLPYSLKKQEHLRGGHTYALMIDFGRVIPTPHLKGVSDAQKFVVNVCGKYYPRSATIDLVNQEISFIHEAFWEFKGGQGREEAEDVLKILQWLIEEKKFKLASGDVKRYRELAALLGGK
ncbi:hypothetical protein ACFLV0_05100 [Chloroflexota bacterium]